MKKNKYKLPPISSISYLHLKRLNLLFAFVFTCGLCSSQWIQTNGPDAYTSKIYFEGNDLIVCCNNKIIRSSDDGVSYSTFGTGFSPVSAAPNRIFTSISKIGSTWIGVAQNEGIYRSTDSGNTWTFSNSGISTIYVNTSAAKGTDFYIGSNLGIHKSTDNGLTWSLINNTIQGIFSISVLFVDGNNIFAGTSGKGLFVSSDDGKTWTDKSISTYISILRNVLCFEKDANYIYAGTAGGGVYRTSDNGTTWTYCNNGNGTYVQGIVSDGTNLYSATSIGIYTSSNSGTNWSNFQANLTETFFYHGSQITAIGINNSKIYVGLRDNKIWKRDLAPTGIKHEKENVIKISPNPFKDFLKVNALERGTIKLYDSTGKLIFAQELSSGEDIVKTIKIPRGLYNCQITNPNGDILSTGKIIKK